MPTYDELGERDKETAKATQFVRGSWASSCTSLGEVPAWEIQTDPDLELTQARGGALKRCPGPLFFLT